MTKGCKVWLWFLLIVNCLGLISGFAAMKYSVGAGLFAVIGSIAVLAGIGLLLFKQKKEGFYVYVAAIAAVFLYNITHHVNIISALLMAVIAPAITFYFLNKSGIFNVGGNTFSSANFQPSASAGTTGQNETSDTYNGTASATTEDNVERDSQNASGDNMSSAKNTGSEKFTQTFQQFGNKTQAKGRANRNINVTVDLYKELNLDRSWDCKSIRKRLRELQKLWIRRQGATNDKEQLLLIDALLVNIEDAFKFLTKENKRQQYDAALDQAYKNGIIRDAAEEQLVTLMDRARAYYRKGNIQLATKCAQEAVDGNINDPGAYVFLAKCYNDQENYPGALAVVDKGLSVFTDNLNLTWFGVRLCTDGLKDFDGAQTRINRLIEIAPEHSIGYSEQVRMHLRKEDEKLAFQEIDSYIAAHPDDNEFKKNVAYDLDYYSYKCFYEDAATESIFIADKKDYEECVRLRRKASEIYVDEHTQNQLDRALYYGQKEFFDWNMESIKGISIVAIIFCLMGMASEAFAAIGIILFACVGALLYFSFRPYWQINKSYVTGEMGALEKAVNQAGPIVYNGSVWLLKTIWWLVIKFFQFAIWLCSGGLFR